MLRRYHGLQVPVALSYLNACLQRIFRGIHGQISLAIPFIDDMDGAERDGDILFRNSEEPSDRDYEGIDLSGR